MYISVGARRKEHACTFAHSAAIRWLSAQAVLRDFATLQHGVIDEHVVQGL